MMIIKKTRELTLSALLAAAAILLGYIESLIPIVPPIAGIKLGLGNIAVLLAMRIFKSSGVSVGIMLSKTIVCAVLFAGVGGLPYSLAGGIASVAVMLPLCRCKRISAAGVSAAGGAAHIAAQTVVAVLMTSTASVISLLPMLMAVGTVTGFINGIIVNLLERRLSRYFLNPCKSE